MMSPDMLREYFSRIGYEGSSAATLDVLQAIHRLHPSMIPFENIDPFLGQTNALDVNRIFHKLVRSERGGWCFEHNLLLKAVLDAIGFETLLLGGRVMLNQPAGTVMPKHHMLLGVKHESETYVADVGFGGLTLAAPVLLKNGIEQETPHEPVRMIADGRGHVIEVNLSGQWTGLYSFEVAGEVLPDFEMSNLYLSNCPDSIFRKGLMAAKVGEGFRLTLRGNRLTRRMKIGLVEVHELQNPSDLVHALVADFGIRLTDEQVRELTAQF